MDEPPFPGLDLKTDSNDEALSDSHLRALQDSKGRPLQVNTHIVPQSQTLRPIRINAHMSTPANSRLPKIDRLPKLTSRQKADQYGDLLIWQQIAFQTQAINVVSPCCHETGKVAPGAGRTHTIRWDAVRGRWTCSCEADKACWHLLCFEANLWWFIECGTISFDTVAKIEAPEVKPSVYSVAANKPAQTVTDAQRAADWGN